MGCLPEPVKFALEPMPMETLDRSVISRKISLMAVRVDAGAIGEIRRAECMRGQVLGVRKTPAIVDDPEPGVKQLRLSAANDGELSPELRAYLDKHGRGYVHGELVLGYDHWSTSEVLAAILPPISSDIPSSFTQTGHIGHVNLRDEWLPYKHMIGQVILDKNPQLRTIVNKLNTIHAEYRFFDMEVIAGDDSADVYIATVNESNCSFTLDFSTVYWNSRLGHEHERLVHLFQPGQVVADVMGGVGPFAVPAAKKGCRVLGNDLNPEGVRWMEVNRVNNKVEQQLRISNFDGREFIRRAPLEAWTRPFPAVQLPKSRKQRDKEARAARQARGDVEKAPSSTSEAIDASSSSALLANLSVSDSAEVKEDELQQVEHFIMNLPDSALTFLDAYRGAYRPLAERAREERGWERDDERLKMPLVHVHCFTRELEFDKAEVDICERASRYLGHALTPTSTASYHLHTVRSVAPNKDMYCLSFRLPREVAFAEDVAVEAGEVPVGLESAGRAGAEQ